MGTYQTSATNGFLQIKDLFKSFGGLKAITDLSLSIEKGKITGIIGPNGAGKTTLFNLITGFLAPDSGAITFNGQNISGLAPHKIVQSGIARTFQDLRLYQKLSALDNVLLGMMGRPGELLLPALTGRHLIGGGHRQDEERAMAYLDTVGLAAVAHRLVETLGYGEQKLLSLARALATEGQLLLLDEPLSGLPEGLTEQMLEVIEKLLDLGKTVILIEHNIEAAMRSCDWVYVLNFGQLIAAGSPDDIMRHETVIEVYLGA